MAGGQLPDRHSMIYANNLWFGVPRGITCDQYGISDATDTTGFVPQPEIWYNLICTFAAACSRYISMEKLISSADGLQLLFTGLPECEILSVGGWWQGGPLSINGKLDEVRLYNRALNAGEKYQIREWLYHATSSLLLIPVVDLKKGLLLYLPFSGSMADSAAIIILRRRWVARRSLIMSMVMPTVRSGDREWRKAAGHQ